MSNIDWDFITEQEGGRVLKGYLPDKKSKSGVTIATGFDLGQRDESDLQGLPISLIEKLKPFLGVKGAKADQVASNLTISDSEGRIIDEFSKGEATDRLAAKWKAATGQDFSELPKSKATTLASVAFQYGDLESRTPNFWNQTTSGDWDAATDNLRNFGDRYGSRRTREANYLMEGRLSETLARTAPPDAPSRQLTDEQLIARVQEEADPPKKKSKVKSPYTDIKVPDWFMGRESGIELPASRPVSPQGVIPEAKDEDTPITVEDMISRDIDLAGPVTEILRKNEFGDANPLYFTEDSKKIWGAAMRQYNPVLALRDYILELGIDDVEDPNYDPAFDPLVKERPELRYRAMHSKSSSETARIAERLNKERYDQDILASSDSGVAELSSALLAPSTIAPMAPMRYMTTTSIPKRFIGGAAFSAAVIAPEQMILQAAREDKTVMDSVAVLALSSLIGGTANAAFGKKYAQAKINRRTARATAFEQADDNQIYESMGAAASPERARQTIYATMERDAAKETGVKAERLGWNPVYRMLKSNNPLVRGLAGEMVDMGGIMTKRVDEELPMAQSVETTFRTKYLSQLLESVRASDEAYLSYRGKVASDSDIVRSFQIIGSQIKDKFASGPRALSEVDFRIRTGKAMRRGDVDNVGDAASPFVTQAAAAARKQFNLIKKNAEEVRLFEKEIEEALSRARAAGDNARVSMLTSKLRQIQSEGVSVNTAESYLPRLYRVDKIMKDPQAFVSTVRSWLIETKGLARAEAQAVADDVFDSVTKSKPYLDVNTGDLDDLLSPSSAKMRSLEIPDELIEEFLESDVEVLLRHHTRTMGMDIEIARRFGSIDMKNVIDDVTGEYEKLISEASGVQAKQTLRKELQNDLRDVRGLRDRLRGTYGASKDPHAISSRFVRTMKSFNVLVGMGGAMISSIPDVARVVMVEGFSNSFDKGLRRQFSRSARAAGALNKNELRKSAVAADAVLGLRAHAFADLGDVFGNRFAVERVLNASTGVMFLLNGLNIWNQTLKEFAGTVTMLRMTEAIMKPWERLSRADKEKLLKNGIGQQEHMRMQISIREHGEQIDGEWMPNTDAWTDGTMRLSFRNALNQNVERIIITPGAGDRALWTSTEFGSMLTQFKSYGQAANVRLLTSGLQERDGAFWQGAFLLVGLGALVNELKRKQYGIDRKETFDEKLINAIDRSGITGYFMDINNAVEKLSHNRLGLRPTLTDQPSRYMPTGAKLNALLGPTAGNIANAASITTDILTGTADAGTKRSSRFLIPGGALPYADPFLDWAYGQ